MQSKLQTALLQLNALPILGNFQHKMEIALVGPELHLNLQKIKLVPTPAAKLAIFAVVFAALSSSLA